MGQRILIAACLSLALTSAASAGVMIQFGGLDIGYNGTNITDVGTPHDPDPLSNATFFVNTVALGADTSGVTLDLNIPGVVNIPAGGGQVSSAANGSLFLDLGGGEFLSLILDSAVVTYVPMASIQFVFAGSSSAIVGQQLPHGLSLINPVSVSFSTQIDPGSVKQSDGYVTAFTSAGTGEIQAVPEPATLVTLFGVAIPMLLKRRAKA